MIQLKMPNQASTENFGSMIRIRTAKMSEKGLKQNIQIEELSLANDWVPSKRSVDVNIILQMLLLTRHPSKYHNYPFHFSPLLPCPIIISAISPHPPNCSQKLKSTFLENQNPEIAKSERFCPCSREFDGVDGARFFYKNLGLLSIYLFYT